MANIRFIFLCFLLLYSQLSAQSTRWIVSLKESSHAEKVPEKCLTEDCNTGIFIFQSDVNEAIARKAIGNSNIDFIEPDYPVTAQKVSNDPDFNNQWFLHNTGQNGGLVNADIGVSDLWAQETGDDSIVVGVLDSGIDWQHPDLVENIWQNLAEDIDGDGTVLFWNGSNWEFDPDDVNGIDDDGNGYIDDFIGWDFVNNDNDPSDDHYAGHGTHISGIIGAQGNNGIGVSGVAWNVSLMTLKFLDNNGQGYTSNAILALDYANQMGAYLSNHSWGGSTFSQALSLAIDQAEQNNHLLVTAAGNSFGNDNDLQPIYPASYTQDNVISVGGSMNRDSVAVFSNIGKASVDLYAPATNIYSTLPNNSYGYQSGTSMAAPMVSGALALLYSKYGILSAGSTRKHLFQSTEQFPEMQYKCVSGGRLDLSKIITRSPFFQKETNLPDTDADVDLSGNWYRIGNQSLTAWVSRFPSNNQQTWTKSFDNIQFNQIEAINDQVIIGGKTLGNSSNGILICLDSAGNEVWSHKIQQGTSPVSIEIIEKDGNDFIISGYVASPLDTNIWVASYTINGSQNWIKTINRSGKNWVPIGLKKIDNDILIIQGKQKAKSFILKVDLGKNAIEAVILDKKTNSRVIPYGLKKDKDSTKIYSIQTKTLKNGRSDIWISKWNVDDWEVDICWKIHAGNSDHSNIQISSNRKNELILLSKIKSSIDEKIWLGIIDNGTIINQQSYAWLGNDFTPSWVSANGDHGIGFGVNTNPVNKWAYVDATGNSFCNNEEGVQNIISGGNIAMSNCKANFLTPVWQVTPLTLTTNSISIADSTICDENNCDVQALFQLASSLVCGGSVIQPINESSNDASFQWFLEGDLVSSLASPTIAIPRIKKNTDDLSLLLVASRGSCVDSFKLKIFPAQALTLLNLDTVHCGARLILPAPIQSPNFSYLWTDSLNNVIGTNSEMEFTQAGNYSLSITNNCGDEFEADIEVSLMPDCMWPGDADGNGKVNMKDYLIIGLNQGETGPVRLNATPNFTGQFALPWAQSFPLSHPIASGINYSYSDSDGDGQIEAEEDGAIVKRNFNSIISGDQVMASPTILDIVFDQHTVTWGDTVEFSIFLENADSSLIQEMYGAALTFSYDLPLAQPIRILPDLSWLDDGTGIDTLVIQDKGKRELHVGITRLNKDGITGNGLLLKGITVVIVDLGNGPDIYSSTSSLTISMTSAFLIREDGTEIQLSNSLAQNSQTLTINPSQSSSQPSQLSLETSSWKIGPNPATNFLRIFPPMPNRISENPVKLRLANSMGQIIWREVLTPRKENLFSEFELPELTSGYYWLIISDPESTSTIPVVIRK